MKNRILIGIIILLLIFIGGYFFYNEARYSNIVKIEANIINNAILTDKKDIKDFMKYIDAKKMINEPISILSPDGNIIDNNVILHYSDGGSESFFITLDNINSELTYLSNVNSATGYKIDKKNTDKILELLIKNQQF